MLKPLEKENGQLRQEIVNLQKKLQSLQTTPHTVTATEVTNEDDVVHTDTAIIKHKCKLMKEEISTQSIHKLPNDHDVRFHALQRDLQECIHGYRECIEFLQSQQHELHEEYEREKKVGEGLKVVIQAAQLKLEQIVQETHTKTEVQDRLKSKFATLDQLNKKRLKEMDSFIDKYFPLPDDATFNKVKRKISHLAQKNDLLSLKEIVKSTAQIHSRRHG